MSMTRLLSLIRKEFVQIIRDPRSLAITFAIPLVQLLLLGFAATSDVRNVRLAVLDQDRSASARDLLSAYRAADYFHIDFDVASEAELRRLIDEGSAGAGLMIPPDYGARLAAEHTASVAFVIDGSDPAIAGTALLGGNSHRAGQIHEGGSYARRRTRAGPIGRRAHRGTNADLVQP